jgi:uncharacterized integral membrane protein
MSPKGWALLVVVFLFVVIFFQNTEPVVLTLFFWSISAPQVLLLPIIMLLGFLLGFFVGKLTGKTGRGA